MEHMEPTATGTQKDTTIRDVTLEPEALNAYSVAEGDPLKQTDDDDLALKALQDLDHFDYTPKEERDVVRKLDWRMMPVMALTFGLYATDKGSIAYAALFDFEEANHLVGQQYSMLTTIFFIGWLVWEYPGNLIAQKVPIAKYLAGIMFFWGICLIMMAACSNFGGLAVLRFLLGMCEAGVQPIFVLMIGMFYKRSEQPARVCFFYGFNSLASILGGPMAYGIGRLDTTFPRWKIFFLTLGAWTIMWSFVVLLVLPDSPMTAPFKTDKERFICIDRLRENRTGIKNSKIKAYQIKEALRDPAVWIFFFWLGSACMMNIQGSFVTILVKGLGFGVLDTALLTMPAGAVQLIGTLALSYLCVWFPNRRGFIVLGVLLVVITGNVLLMALPLSEKWARLVGVWLIAGVSTTVPIMLSYGASNLSGYTKKNTSVTMTFVAFSIGNIVSPQLFLKTEAPRYGTALRGMLVSSCILELLTALLLVIYHLRNKRRARLLQQQEASGAFEEDASEMRDRTDFEDPSFRYMY